MTGNDDVPTWKCPPLYNTYSPRINPDAAVLYEDLASWLRRFGFLGTAREKDIWLNYNYIEGLARFFPEGTGPGVKFGYRWFAAATLTDDLMFDSGPYSADCGALAEKSQWLLRTLESPTAPVDPSVPYGEMWRDLSLEIRNLAPPVVIEQCVNEHTRWFSAATTQRGLSVAGKMPSLDYFLFLRIHSIAILPLMLATDILDESGAELSYEERHSTPVRILRESTALLHAFDNDLFSYDKERPRPGSPVEFNNIDIMRAERGCSLAEAFSEVILLRNKIAHLFQKLRDQVRPTASTALRAHIDAIGQGLRAGLDWYLSPKTLRYAWNRVPHELGIQRPTELVDTWPPGMDDSPPDLPSIRWWWDQLQQGG